MKGMKKLFKVSLLALILVILIASSSQPVLAAQNLKAKQIQLNVSGVYSIVTMYIKGDNQYGTLTYWPPKDPNVFYLQRPAGSAPIYPFTCKYSSNAAGCPQQKKTTGYWWSGYVTVYFEVYPNVNIPYGAPFFSSTGLQKVTCSVFMDEKVLWDTITISYDAGRQLASGATCTVSK